MKSYPIYEPARSRSASRRQIERRTARCVPALQLRAISGACSLRMQPAAIERMSQLQLRNRIAVVGTALLFATSHRPKNGATARKKEHRSGRVLGAALVCAVPLRPLERVFVLATSGQPTRDERRPLKSCARSVSLVCLFAALGRPAKAI